MPMVIFYAEGITIVRPSEEMTTNKVLTLTKYRELNDWLIDYYFWTLLRKIADQGLLKFAQLSHEHVDYSNKISQRILPRSGRNMLTCAYCWVMYSGWITDKVKSAPLIGVMICTIICRHIKLNENQLRSNRHDSFLFYLIDFEPYSET